MKARRKRRVRFWDFESHVARFYFEYFSLYPPFGILGKSVFHKRHLKKPVIGPFYRITDVLVSLKAFGAKKKVMVKYFLVMRIERLFCCTYWHVAANLSLYIQHYTQSLFFGTFHTDTAKMIYNCQFLVVIFVLLAVSAKAFQMQSSRMSNVGSMRMALADYREELARTAAAISAPGMLWYGEPNESRFVYLQDLLLTIIALPSLQAKVF